MESWLQDTNQDTLKKNKNKRKKINSVLVPGFVQVQKNRTHTVGGGILIMIRESIAFKEISVNSPHPCLEVCKIQLTHTNPILDIIVCYRGTVKPPHIITQNAFDKLTSLVDQNSQSLFCGDFNSHNIIWNCNHDDPYGLFLENSVNSQNLFLHNHDTFTYQSPVNGTLSNLDLIFSTLNIASNIKTSVFDDTWGSDHFPILCTIDLEKNLHRKKSHKIRSYRTKDLKFVTILNNNYHQFNSSEFNALPANDKYNRFTNFIIETLKKCTPIPRIVNNKKHINPVPWWDNDCDKARRLKKAAYRKWCFTKSVDDRTKYNKLNYAANKLFKLKKKQSFIKFAESIDMHTDPTYVWKTCKLLKNKWCNVQPNNVQSNLQNDQCINDTLERIAPLGNVCECNQYPNFTASPNNNSFFDKPFNIDEFNLILETKRNKSAAGMDGIDYITLKNLPNEYKCLILNIFNEIYLTHCYPDSWHNSFVLFIPKPNDRGVRPISLTPTLCKLFESLIKLRLQWFCEYHNILPKNQSGSRKGRSCIDNLTEFVLKTESALLKNKDVIAVFLDVSKAYDNVHCDILTKKLASIGCSESLITFTQFLTKCRHIYTQSLNDQSRFSLKGVPQGGVLSSLLYAIYVKDITVNIPTSITISQFVDNVGAYCSYGSADKSIDIVEKGIKILIENLNLIKRNSYT